MIFFLYLKIGEKEKKIKERISKRSLALFHIKQQLIHNICTKLQNPRCNSSWEIFVTNFPMYYIGVRDGKKEKDGKINLRFVFCPTESLATLNVYTKFEDSGSHRRWGICNRKFAWRERKFDKWRKWQVETYWFSFTQYNRSYSKFVPNFKTLGALVPDKSLTQISLCFTLEWAMKKGKIWKKKAKINHSVLVFFLPYSILGPSQGVYKIWRLWLS